MVQKVAPASSCSSPCCAWGRFWEWRQQGTQVVVGAVLFFRRSVFSAETGSLTPGHSQADKATHSWAGLCWPLFLSVKQLRETQSDPEAEPSGFPLNQPSPIHSPAAWVLVECTPCLQNLGLTGGRASHVLLYPQLMVLDRWSERRWLCLRMNGFQVSYT